MLAKLLLKKRLLEASRRENSSNSRLDRLTRSQRVRPKERFISQGGKARVLLPVHSLGLFSVLLDKGAIYHYHNDIKIN